MNTIKSKEEFEKLSKENPEKLVMLKFSASWCGPCRQLAKVMESVEADYNNVIMAEIDVDDAIDDIFESYEVTNIPVTVFMRDGLLIDRVTGGMTTVQLRDKINENLNK